MDAINSICKIKVFGVGGAGNNAVNRMIDSNVNCAEFFSVNTDLQALMLSRVPTENRIQIGKQTTNGLGAGSFPEIGERAAEEDIKDIESAVTGANLVYVTCGMGGGTGTGAAPVVAKVAKEKGAVVIGVVSKPFSYEGKKRFDNAKKGISNLSKYVDTMIIVPNDKIIATVKEDLPFDEALKIADDNLKQAICSISDLIVTPGLINLDFADVKAVVEKQGIAHMGFGKAKGENRILEAVRNSVSSPMLETNVKGASNILVNIVGDKTMSIGEVTKASDLIKKVVSPNANIISGASINPNLNSEVQVTIIATGFINGIQETNQASIEENRNIFDSLVEKPSQIVENVTQNGVESKQEETPKKENEDINKKGKSGKPPFLSKIFK